MPKIKILYCLTCGHSAGCYENFDGGDYHLIALDNTSDGPSDYKECEGLFAELPERQASIFEAVLTADMVIEHLTQEEVHIWLIEAGL